MASAGEEAVTWRAGDVLSGGADRRYACLLLNRPVDGREELETSVWNRAACRVAVDGGANVLRRLMTSPPADPAAGAVQPPHFICGDFDSMTDETRAFFAGRPLVPTPDQDETDFTKALRAVAARGLAGLGWVTAVADCSGRLDQTLANINTLHKAAGLLPAPVFLLSRDSLSWLLAAGRHRVHLSGALGRDWCSLVPVGAPAAAVTTAGLQWDLDGQRMAFGELVSTSNRAVADLVTVHTSHPLLFSVAL